MQRSLRFLLLFPEGSGSNGSRGHAVNSLSTTGLKAGSAVGFSPIGVTLPSSGGSLKGFVSDSQPEPVPVSVFPRSAVRISAAGMIEGGREALGLFVPKEFRDCLAGYGWTAGEPCEEEAKDGVRRCGSNAAEVGLAYDRVP